MKTLSVLLVVTFGLAFHPVSHAADAQTSMTPADSEMHTLERKNVDVKGNLDQDVKANAKHDKDCDCKECAGKKGKKSCKTCKHCQMGHRHDKHNDQHGDDAKESEHPADDAKAATAPAKKE